MPRIVKGLRLRQERVCEKHRDQGAQGGANLEPDLAEMSVEELEKKYNAKAKTGII